MVHSTVLPLAQPWRFDPPRPRTVRRGALLGVMVLLLAVADGWLPHVLQRDASAGSPSSSGGDVGRAVDQAAHTALAGAEPGSLVVSDSAYRATFDRGGVSYAPAGSGGVFDLGL